MAFQNQLPPQRPHVEAVPAAWQSLVGIRRLCICG
jgi:hypothetical protein